MPMMGNAQRLSVSDNVLSEHFNLNADSINGIIASRYKKSRQPMSGLEIFLAGGILLCNAVLVGSIVLERKRKPLSQGKEIVPDSAGAMTDPENQLRQKKIRCGTKQL